MNKAQIFPRFSYFVLIVLVGLSTSLWSQDIFEAVKKGNVEGVEKLVKDDPSLVNKKNEQGNTLLKFAAQKLFEKVIDGQDTTGQFKIIENIIQYGEATLDYTYALGVFSAVGYRDIVSLLLEKPGIQLDTEYEGGECVLHFAVISGNPEIINMLASRAPSLIYKKNKNGETPLDMCETFYNVFKALRNNEKVGFPSQLSKTTKRDEKLYPLIELLNTAYSKEEENLHISRLNSEQQKELENVYNNYARSLAIMLEYVLRDLYQALAHLSMHVQ